MLVLSRQREQEIWIGPPGSPLIKIMLVDIRGDKVRIGIESPKEYAVHRREVAEEIVREALPVAAGGKAVTG